MLRNLLMIWIKITSLRLCVSQFRFKVSISDIMARVGIIVVQIIMYFGNHHLVYASIDDNSHSMFVSSNDVSAYARCHQTLKNKKADCASRNLESVPDGLPTDVQVLDLSNNLIKIIYNSSFRVYTHILNLSLKYNEISVIEDGAFYPLEFLESLDLSHNKGLLLPSANVFSKSNHLQVLNLNMCNLSTIPKDILTRMSRLQILDFGSNAIDSVNISSCERTENLSVNLENNNFQNITRGNFIFDCRIASLNLNSSVTVADPDVIAFMEVQHLLLQISESSEEWKTVFQGLSMSKIRELEVWSQYSVSHFLPDFFYPMQNKSMATLKLSISILSKLSPDIFSNLTLVSELAITNSKIRIIEPDHFGGMKELRVLCLRENMIEYINRNGNKWEIDLFELDVSYNNLHRWESSRTLRGLENVSILDLSNNRRLGFLSISSMRLRSLDVSYTAISVMMLHTPLLRSIVFEYPLTKAELIKEWGLFDEAPSLEEIDMTGSGLANLLRFGSEVSLFQGLYNLSTLRLSHNLMSELRGGIFLDQVLLVQLDLQGCGLARIEPDAFEGLRSLQSLLLQDNNLQLLPGNLLTGMKHLTHLHVDGNNLDFLEENLFDDTPSLLHFTIAHNHLANINDTTFKTMNSTLAMLDISNNPLVCDCELKWLPVWLGGSIIIINENETRCSSASLPPLRGSPVMLFKPDQHCGPNVIVYASTLLVGMALVAAAVIVYHNRWDLKHKLFMFKMAIMGYHDPEDGLDNNDFELDLNVMYIDDDEEWVMNHLQPILREKFPNFQRIGFGDNDLMLGMHYLDAVLHQVKNSYKTVILLSRAAFRDNWFMSKFRIALDHDNGVQTENVFVVFLEDIPDEELPFVVREYLNDGRPYITWVRDERSRDYFWAELLHSLRLDYGRMHLVAQE